MTTQTTSLNTGIFKSELALWLGIITAVIFFTYGYVLSLGSHGAETSIALPSLISDPIKGGVFAGPPFLNSISPRLAGIRNPGSPYWLPVIQDSSLVRFTAQENALDIPGAQ